ncbi:hypothetical protein BCR23_14040 [Enterococcus quebecensis]|uniref:Uncharacterized protein n=1 Tax=Enterococcus quebecensis TaxID=903983 RepID=A0A1E5H060_9ENTE|nr:hypothetical protein BCR23_14040 [Enterococcus quebecensis]
MTKFNLVKVSLFQANYRSINKNRENQYSFAKIQIENSHSLWMSKQKFSTNFPLHCECIKKSNNWQEKWK